MLDPTQRARYARHLLLPEIGDSGQAKLNAARVRASADADPTVAEVALDYLTRAGVQLDSDEQATPLRLADTAEVNLVAGAPQLQTASAFLLGALAAVEAIKQVTGAGTAGTVPDNFVLGQKV